LYLEDRRVHEVVSFPGKTSLKGGKGFLWSFCAKSGRKTPLAVKTNDQLDFEQHFQDDSDQNQVRGFFLDLGTKPERWKGCFLWSYCAKSGRKTSLAGKSNNRRAFEQGFQDDSGQNQVGSDPSRFS